MTPMRFLRWGDANALQVAGAVVPAGEVWLLHTWGIATEDNRVLDYMMQHVVPPGWYVPVARSPQAGSTPVLAGDRNLVLQEGEYLLARVNSGGTPFARMGILHAGWSFPVAELPRLLGMTASGTTAPDFTAFKAAVESATVALAGVVEATP